MCSLADMSFTGYVWTRRTGTAGSRPLKCTSVHYVDQNNKQSSSDHNSPIKQRPSASYYPGTEPNTVGYGRPETPEARESASSQHTGKAAGDEDVDRIGRLKDCLKASLLPLSQWTWQDVASFYVLPPCWWLLAHKVGHLLGFKSLFDQWHVQLHLQPAILADMSIPDSVLCLSKVARPASRSNNATFPHKTCRPETSVSSTSKITPAADATRRPSRVSRPTAVEDPIGS